MAATNNTALYVGEKGDFSVRRDFAIPEPEDHELLVEVLFSGVNPADLKHYLLGFVSTVPGYDFSGRVLRAPPGSSYSPGEPVAGYAPFGIGRPKTYGAHQNYLVADEDMIFRVPANLPLAHAACLTAVAATAGDVLFNICGIPFPSTTSNQTQGEEDGPLLIWGASTSVGICVLQLARACGTSPIFVTASPARHELLKTYGATQCFDYSDPNVETKIRNAVQAAQRGPIKYAVDAAGSTEEPTSADLMAKCVEKETKMISSITRADPRFRMPFGMKCRSVKLLYPGAGEVDIPANPKEHEFLWKSVLWAADNYGTRFSLPAVEVFSGSAEEALEQAKIVARGGKFGKVALQHPWH